MTLAATAWSTLAAVLLLLGLRMTLAEAVWAGARHHDRVPRRVLRGLDLLVVLLALGLVAALVGVIAPPIMAQR